MTTFNTLPISWEIVNLADGGANLAIQATRALTIVGLQFDIAMAPAPPSFQTGFSEVFAEAAIITGTPTFSTGPERYLAGPAALNSDFKSSPIDNPNAFQITNAVIGWTGQLFAVILKANLPTCESRSLTLTDLSIDIAAGNYLVFHMDGAGVPADVEMQGTIFYY